LDWTKIQKAVEAIQSGLGNRIVLKEEGVVVYKIGNQDVIRVDIKTQ
jgi:N6-adenosine-specific RNA methylase IME4